MEINTDVRARELFAHENDTLTARPQLHKQVGHSEEKSTMLAGIQAGGKIERVSIKLTGNI